ncbi:hypothetical protein RIF29_36242 [Crotalaria pallida]|uniref:WAT1-related protein n=1 Tax=Crotalaria pallida TaxID=3830 RepID=A0AAN9EB82_CROPI
MVRWLQDGGEKSLPFVAMVIVLLCQSGSMVVIKVALANEMNKYVMVVYSFALSTFTLLPFLLLHRSERPPLTFSTLCSFFLLALFGVIVLLSLLMIKTGMRSISKRYIKFLRERKE